jgi:hypothetical protein
MTEFGPPESLPPRDILGILNLTKYAEASHALIAAGILEDWLQTMLLAAGRQLSNTQLAEFFDSYGPLNTFSAKIDISYFFKLINETTYRDLKAIKNVRNCFAHAKEIVTFEDEDVKRKGQSLTNWTRGVELRVLYLDRVQFCLDEIRIVIERQIAKAAFEDDNTS